jgi:hypothetical protein
MRFTASQPPRPTPKRRIASLAYAEQLGWNRQDGGSAGLKP